MSVRLFVGNLPYGASEAELREYFGAVGQPSQIIMPTDRETGRQRGFAFVEYADRAMAQEAIRRFDAQPFKGRPLAVSEARPREERAPGSRPPGGGPAGPRSMRSFESAPVPGSRGGQTRREGGGPARRTAKKGQWTEEKPKRPIQVRTTGRIYDVEGDDSGEDVEGDNSGEDVEIDNFATSAKPQAEDSGEDVEIDNFATSAKPQAEEEDEPEKE